MFLEKVWDQVRASPNPFWRSIHLAPEPGPRKIVGLRKKKLVFSVRILIRVVKRRYNCSKTNRSNFMRL
jgi:hypothetical protein